MKLVNSSTVVFGTALTIFAVVGSGCSGDSDSDPTPAPDGGTTANMDGATGAGPVIVEGDIMVTTTWPRGVYVLTKKTHVVNNAVLTIAPGSVIYGAADVAGDPPALIVTRGAQLIAEGTAADPIVFTSGLEATARAPGDFGGIVLLGNATINDGTCVGDGDPNTEACDAPGFLAQTVEGIPPNDPRGTYGGTDDSSNCGTLRYVRVEFGGFKLGQDNELNGITVGGCGTGTTLSYIQVHRGNDDGIEFFGGTAGFDHVLLSGNADDSLDWDEGWRGKGQFLIVHQFDVGDEGFESDNLGKDEAAVPTSNPELWNVTMVGTPATGAFHMKEGTLGKFRNFIIQGFAHVLNTSYATVTVPSIFMLDTGLSIKNSYMWNNIAVGFTDVEDDDMAFDETAMLTAAVGDPLNALSVAVDPMLDASFVPGASRPTYVPLAPAASLMGAAPPAPMDVTATYAGAVAPGGVDWTLGWTDFPEGQLPTP